MQEGQEHTVVGSNSPVIGEGSEVKGSEGNMTETEVREAFLKAQLARLDKPESETGFYSWEEKIKGMAIRGVGLIKDARFSPPSQEQMQGVFKDMLTKAVELYVTQIAPVKFSSSAQTPENLTLVDPDNKAEGVGLLSGMIEAAWKAVPSSGWESALYTGGYDSIKARETAEKDAEYLLTLDASRGEKVVRAGFELALLHLCGRFDNERDFARALSENEEGKELLKQGVRVGSALFDSLGRQRLEGGKTWWNTKDFQRCTSVQA